LDKLVISLIANHALDIVVLVERPFRSGLATSLSPSGWQRVNRSERFTVLAKQAIKFTRPPNLGPNPTDRAEFWHVEPAGEESWLFALIHGPDRRNATDDTRRLVFSRLRETVRLLETRFGHRRTVILGDLNANPHDPAVLSADGLHAIGVKLIRGQIDRAIRNAGRMDFFYNPTWRLYGSDPTGDAAAGSYYYHDGYDVNEPFWHLLDQVLIRPEYADRLPPDELRILTVSGPTALVDAQGCPDSNTGSDHLPVVFRLL
jgi:hypothetical protein